MNVVTINAIKTIAQNIGTNYNIMTETQQNTQDTITKREVGSFNRLYGITPLYENNLTTGNVYIIVSKTNKANCKIGKLIKKAEPPTNPDPHFDIYTSDNTHPEYVLIQNVDICLLDTFVITLQAHIAEAPTQYLIAKLAVLPIPSLQLLGQQIRTIFGFPDNNLSNLSMDLHNEELDEELEEELGGGIRNKNRSKKTKHYRNRKHTKKTKHYRNRKHTKKTKRNKTKKTKRNKNAI